MNTSTSNQAGSGSPSSSSSAEFQSSAEVSPRAAPTPETRPKAPSNLQLSESASSRRESLSDSSPEKPPLNKPLRRRTTELEANEPASPRSTQFSAYLESLKGVELHRLKDALSAKLQQNERELVANRATASTHTVKNENFATSAYEFPPSRLSGPRTLPKLDAAFQASPVDRISRGSTQSTDSNRTVRGFNPSDAIAQTPSYPFPRIPSLSKQLAKQSLETLSPTGESPFSGIDDYRESAFSNLSTPIVPRGDPFRIGQDEYISDASSNLLRQYPCPNLYDLVLELSSQDSLESWWEVLSELLRTWYKADRATLAVPADPSDVQNVPWGLKAVYDANSLGERMTGTRHIWGITPAATPGAGADSTTQSKAHGGSTGGASNKRPSLLSRHSYAGHETKRRQNSEESTKSPQSLSRNFPKSPFRELSSIISDKPNLEVSPSSASTEFRSSLADYYDLESQQSHVFPVLQPLGNEKESLLDTVNVNRVLETGSIMVLTRDFSAMPEFADSRASEGSVSSQDETIHGTERKKGTKGRQLEQQKSSAGSQAYAEYEQPSASPWSQSPAPSPAIQADEEENPFFRSGQVLEGSFSPKTSTDYSDSTPIEAIGVDRASTVIHVPLIHPSRSQANNHMKVPLAVLSFHCRVVPYPHHLSDAIRDLGPHLASQLQLQTQLASAMAQRDLNWMPDLEGRLLVSNTLSSGETPSRTMLRDLSHTAKADDTESMSSQTPSITSASEYSARSGHSNNPSALTSPLADSSHQSLHITDADALTQRAYNAGFKLDHLKLQKRKTPMRSVSTTVVPTGLHESTSRPPSGQDSGPSQSSLRKQKPIAGPTIKRARSNQKLVRVQEDTPKSKDTADEEASKRKSATRSELTTLPKRDSRIHSVLHSYGADFQASFQSLPAAAGISHSRSFSGSDLQDMPPPSERLLRTIIDSLPVQIFTAHAVSGSVSWVNSKYLVYRGDSPAEVLRSPWSSIHAEDLFAYLESWRGALRQGEQFQHKVRLRRFDGEYRWFLTRVVPLRDRHQNIAHWIGTFVDFHEQHMAERNAARQKETAASEAKYRALANSSPQIVFAATRDSGVTFCNLRWFDYSGQTEEEARGVGFMDHVHPDDLVKCKLPEFGGRGDVATNVPTSIPSQPRRTRSDNLGSPASVYSTDSHRASISGITASSPSDLPQRKLSELASTGILKAVKDSAGRPSYSTEVRLRNKKGEYRWHMVRLLLAEPLIQAQTNEETWYGSCSDINDHKELESQLKDSMEAKTRFLSNMSHEIRTPINGIWGMAQLLMASANLNEEQMDQLNVIRTSTEGLRDLINDILDLSKVEAGMIQLQWDWLNIFSIIEEVNDLTVSLATDKGLELNFLVEPEVPSVVKGDKFRIRQVLLNVIGNAIKFTDKGEVLLRCRVVEDDDEGLPPDCIMIECSVHDTGKGFDDKQAEKLFKRFSQIDTSNTRQHGGTGLGLAISMQLVELHGGVMSATSVPDEGSTFSFSLKVGMPSKDDEAKLEELGDRVGKDQTATILSTPTPRKAQRSAVSEGAAKGAVIADELTSTPPAIKSPIRPSLKSDSSQDSEKGLPSASSQTSKKSSQSSMDSSTGLIPSQTVGKKRAPSVRSVLIICDLPWAREATTHHVNAAILGDESFRSITSEDVPSGIQMLESKFEADISHVVFNVGDSRSIVTAIQKSTKGNIRLPKVFVVAAALNQKREIFSLGEELNVDVAQFVQNRRLYFVQKPLKPTKLSGIFNVQYAKDTPAEQTQNVAQQVAVTQKQLFEDMTRRLSGRNLNVLVVEDNPNNQKVMLRLLSRVKIKTESALDGEQCVEKVFSQPEGHYSMILCDLHMPNKDGLETCKEIREWERRNNYRTIPIIALSADVLGDVYDACVRAGFNAYLTKPVEFQELSEIMTKLLDPVNPSTEIPFLTPQKRH